MTALTKSETEALRFYIGDVSGCDPFYGDPGAYVVLNALFFPGISAETDRAAEGKILNPAIISETGRLLGFFRGLFSAFRKCSAQSNIRTFRVERFSDYTKCRASGCTISMTSTSTAGFLSEYRDRLGIALMRFTITAGTPCIDVAEALPEYAKPQEAEILLPPFLELSLSEKQPAGEELLLSDSAGKPPIVSCSAVTGNIKPFFGEASVLPDGGNAAGIRIFQALSSGKQPLPEDVLLYSQWKSALAVQLHKMLAE